MSPDPDSGTRFDPTDPADLEQLAEHLHQRTGRTFTVPAPFEWPIDVGDPNTSWATYPEDPAVRHHDRATRTIIDISFPDGNAYRLFGWVWEGDPLRCRVIDRRGRHHHCGPPELADALSALITRLLTGDP